MTEEGVLDPWVADWMAGSPMGSAPLEDLSPEMLELARGPVGARSQRDIQIDHISDELVGDVPVRIYQPDGPVTGVVAYFHGGGFVMGSIGIMDNVARALSEASGGVVVSVGYRLAPEHPYPAGLDDCEAVTRWAVANAGRFGVSSRRVAVAGESAGGNLAAAVSLRTRDAGDLSLAGQVLVYPATAGTEVFPSRREFDGLVISLAAGEKYWQAYSAGRDLDSDPYAVPLSAKSLAGLPPALVILGGCDMLRDEGRAYSRRLRDAGVDLQEVSYPGQPHGFVNFEFPAALEAFSKIGGWLRTIFARAD